MAVLHRALLWLLLLPQLLFLGLGCEFVLEY